MFSILPAHGNVYSWGFGTYGQLGQGEEKIFLKFPRRIKDEPLKRNVVAVGCGDHYSTAITGEY